MEGKEDKVAVVLFLTTEQYESLRLMAEFLGCSISDAFAKIMEIAQSWDDEFKQTIVERILKGLKSQGST
jgi:hypothetical protein